MLSKKLRHLSKIILSCLAVPTVFASIANGAATSTNNKPVFIHSNQSIFNVKTHITTYSGNVIATHGDSQLTGKQLILISDQHNQLIKMITTGNTEKQAKLFSKEPNQPLITAQSNTIFYYPQQHTAVLVGRAIANQGHDQIQGPILQYDVKNKILIANKIDNKAPLALIDNDDSNTTSNNNSAGKA